MEDVKSPSPREGSTQPGATDIGKYCVHCGKELGPDLRFCDGCGRVIAYGRHACSECGADLPTDSGFCGKCGTKAPPAADAEPDIRPAMQYAYEDWLKTGNRPCLEAFVNHLKFGIESGRLTAAHIEYLTHQYDAVSQSKGFKKLMRRLREQSTCSTCGAEMPPSTAFCARCGSQFKSVWSARQGVAAGAPSPQTDGSREAEGPSLEAGSPEMIKRVVIGVGVVVLLVALLFVGTERECASRRMAWAFGQNVWRVRANMRCPVGGTFSWNAEGAATCSVHGPLTDNQIEAVRLSR